MTALNLNLLLGFTPSTSGTYTFSVTRDQIIRQAMLDIGALQEAESPTAQETSDCAFVLNTMVKQWMGQNDFAPGLKIWTRRRAELFLGYSRYAYNLGLSGDNWVDSTAGQAYPQLYGQTTLTAAAAANATVLNVAAASQFNIGDYIGILVGADIQWTTVLNFNTVANTVTIPTPGLTGAIGSGAYVWNYTTKAVRPISIISCVLRDIYANDTPMNYMTTERYESLPTKTAPTNISDPTSFLYEPQYRQQSPNGILYLDVAGAQDVTKHLHVVYLAPTQDFNNPGDAPDYPQVWFSPLVLGLGKRIAPMFDCDWTKTLEEQRMEALAIARQDNAATTDVFFEPNAEGPYTP